MGSDVGGQIHGISLDSFLQMAQMEKTTCTLTVRADSDLGVIYLLKGELIEAETGVLSSADAAYDDLLARARSMHDNMPPEQQAYKEGSPTESMGTKPPCPQGAQARSRPSRCVMAYALVDKAASPEQWN